MNPKLERKFTRSNFKQDDKDDFASSIVMNIRAETLADRFKKVMKRNGTVFYEPTEADKKHGLKQEDLDQLERLN